MTRLSRTVRFGHRLGAMVAGVFATVAGLLLLPYFTDVPRVPPALAGVLLVSAKVWDVLWSPVAGRVSDRCAARRPFLLAQALHAPSAH